MDDTQTDFKRTETNMSKVETTINGTETDITKRESEISQSTHTTDPLVAMGFTDAEDRSITDERPTCEQTDIQTHTDTIV